MKKASAKKARGKKKVVTKKECAASGATKRRSAGTKLEPTCAICQKRAHYSSTCPLLAQKLLAAVRKAANTKQIAEYLAANDKAFVQGMTGKVLKTLKRRSRGKPWHKTTATVKSRKVRKVAAKKSHAAKDKLRTPKPVKQKAKLPVTRKSTEAAYRSLKRRQWAWKPGPCNACAGELVLQSWKSCQCRSPGGRLFYRHENCQEYFDVLSFSHLRVCRMPLAWISKAVEMHFQQSPPQSASNIGRAIGASATPGGQAQGW